jgi:branched-chain amino acid transport system ATP-binding protein
MLQIKNLSAGYEKLPVLKNVSMEIKAGEIVALMGPNGAGKSTLLKSIFNLTEITAGEILFEEKNIVGLKPYQLTTMGVCYLPQGRINFGDMTVEENLEISIINKGKEIIDKNLEQVYKQFPILKEKQNKYAYTLSGGQQQMLAFGRALMQDPELLLLDEPSLGLSPKLVKEIFAKIKELNQKFNVTMLVVEHNIKSILDICDHGYLMRGGEIVVSGDAQKLKTSEIMNEAFFGTNK